MTISSPVAGLRPIRFLLAGLLAVLILRRPGSTNSPTALLRICLSIRSSSSAITESTCFFERAVLVAISETIALLLILALIPGAFFTAGAAFFFAAGFFAFAGAFLTAAFFLVAISVPLG